MKKNPPIFCLFLIFNQTSPILKKNCSVVKLFGIRLTLLCFTSKFPDVAYLGLFDGRLALLSQCVQQRRFADPARSYQQKLR